MGSEQKTPRPAVSTGRIERLDNFKSKHIASRHVDVWLPNGYSEHDRYPVLYMHDGQMLYDASTTWNKQAWDVSSVLGALIVSGEIPPCIVVGIWNSVEGRHGDYFPQKPFNSLPEPSQKKILAGMAAGADGKSGIRSDSYLRFIVEELKPAIDQRYATRPDRENTFIAGSSMGGLISMYALCEYPDHFYGAACLSTHWIGVGPQPDNPIPAAFAAYLERALPDPATHKLYFDFGTETLDAHYEPHQRLVDEIMRDKGYDDTNWLTLKFDGANHSEQAWNDRLDLPIKFLMQQST